MSINYSKLPVPSDPKDIPAYLQSELDRIADVISNIADGHFDTTNVAPPKPRAGDVRYADGTNFNPGSGGEGLYIYLSSGAWSKL
jgi:hypothetical protein|tara:strand:+ start:150 stop:404 length:255 start_codon:yes stop_codon:yes gene_type:complete